MIYHLAVNCASSLCLCLPQFPPFDLPRIFPSFFLTCLTSSWGIGKGEDLERLLPVAVGMVLASDSVSRPVFCWPLSTLRSLELLPQAFLCSISKKGLDVLLEMALLWTQA